MYLYKPPKPRDQGRVSEPGLLTCPGIRGVKSKAVVIHQQYKTKQHYKLLPPQEIVTTTTTKRLHEVKIITSRNFLKKTRSI